MTQIMTTDSVVPARRVGYWQAAVGETFVRGDCVSRAGARFVGRMHSRVLGRLPCSLVDSVEQRVDRTPANIAADGADCFLLSLQREGRGCLTQLGRDAHLAPGDPGALRHRTPSSRSAGEDAAHGAEDPTFGTERADGVG